jgi:tetratricopeptide (TPR) repeat protein
MPRPFPGALFCAVLVHACRSPEEAPREPALASSAELEARRSDGEITAEAARLLEEGRIEEARAALDEVLLAGNLERARAELARGSPEDALTTVDRVLELAPDDLEARLLKADASLRLAEAKIRDGGSASLIEGALGDALDYYHGAGESAHTLFGSSRAAWLLGQREKALELARRGLPLRKEGDPALRALGLVPERMWAEQVLDAYTRARAESSEAASEAARVLFAECEDALAKLLGRASVDPWAWRSLSDLYEGENALAEARVACESGIARVPGDDGLLERLARVTGKLEGPAATVRALEELARANPEIIAGRWHLAVARFALALAGYTQEPRVLDPAPFLAAEAEFRALRERAPERTQAALGYEVVCRLARGWCAFHAGELSRARAEFLAMNALFQRGIEWSLPGELESGIQGLFFVADAHGARDELLEAGEIFETLHALEPGEVQWANNAGFFLRDAAVALAREAERLCSALGGTLTNAEALAELRALAGIEGATAGSAEERAALARAAGERCARARALMERSWQAYRPAAELAPEDVRVVNDAALVLVYYLHHDLEWAEQALLRCVALGGGELEEKRAALALEASPERASALESEITLLTEAWGDAHQNLGVLEWVHRRNAPAARAWLEKALEIWPDRAPVTNSLLPQVRGELAPEKGDAWDLLGWARPCALH